MSTGPLEAVGGLRSLYRSATASQSLPGAGRHPDGRGAALRRGVSVARAPGLLGRVAAALDICRRRMGARCGVRSTRRGRPPMVWTIQVEDGNAVRLVGHVALRPALRAARSGGPARGQPMTGETPACFGTNAASIAVRGRQRACEVGPASRRPRRSALGLGDGSCNKI